MHSRFWYGYPNMDVVVRIGCPPSMEKLVKQFKIRLSWSGCHKAKDI